MAAAVWLGDQRWLPSDTYLKWAVQWLLDLIKANQRVCRYPPRELDWVIRKRWLKPCRQASPASVGGPSCIIGDRCYGWGMGANHAAAPGSAPEAWSPSVQLTSWQYGAPGWYIAGMVHQ